MEINIYKKDSHKTTSLLKHHMNIYKSMNSNHQCQICMQTDLQQNCMTIDQGLKYGQMYLFVTQKKMKYHFKILVL